MDQEFIRLMQILLGNPNPAIPSKNHYLNPDYSTVINNHVDDLNRCLRLKGEKAFIGSHPCPANTSNMVIAPVVFASSYNQRLEENQTPFEFAVFGLNPLFNTHNNSVCKEKRLAGNNLGDYAAFYNSMSCTTRGVFPFVLDPMSTYYQNLFRIFNSLFDGSFCSWTSVFPSTLSSKQKADKYIKAIEKCPIIVAELIPFHSQKTDTIDINNLYYHNPKYRTYHEELFRILDSKITSNGIIFSHGKAASETLRQILISYGVIIRRINPKYEIAVWKGRLVVILDQFLRTINGVNSDNDHKVLIKDVIDELKSQRMSLPCRCNK